MCIISLNTMSVLASGSTCSKSAYSGCLKVAAQILHTVSVLPVLPIGNRPLSKFCMLCQALAKYPCLMLASPQLMVYCGLGCASIMAGVGTKDSPSGGNEPVL